MSNAFCERCRVCYESAIYNGAVAQTFYAHLAALFHHEHKAASVFRVLAQDEADFARVLKKVQDGEGHSLKVHAEAKLLGPALRRLSVDFGDRLKAYPQDLDEAWKLACDLERSVLHEAFLKLTRELAEPNGRTHDFFTKSVEAHLKRLRGLGKRYPAAKRRMIKPVGTDRPHP